VIQIIVADVSMSLDNLLAVAGAAHGHHPAILIFGLGLSVILMGVAATFIARLLTKHRWIAYVGLLIILYVAIKMMWDGGLQVRECNPSWFGAGTEMTTACPLHPDYKPNH
jgi:predicted tellurium resistance membrane protein TerC